jgi:hypothetical protein
MRYGNVRSFLLQTIVRRHQLGVIDRKLNVVVFGVPEDRDAMVWPQMVNDALRHVTNHSVDVADMFRLGRYDSNKKRPVLVKLKAFWDKRLIMSNCYKLKQFSQRGIFIASDEPLEVRRKQTLDRTKYRAERDNKITSVRDGVLVVDDVAVFSLAEGLLNSTSTRNG